jgi:exodeoxyribonuclease V alpha subunit
VPPDLVGALEAELAAGTVIADRIGATDGTGSPGTACIFLADLHRAEREAAERLLRIAKGSPPWPHIDADKALPWVEQRTGLALAPEQKEAVRRALGAKAMVITGGPGVGKTTIVNAILRILGAKGATLMLCAPTGRAARRMSEATGMEARTIHRLLEVDPILGGFRRNRDNPLDCDFLVVDETSMVDVRLMQALLRAVKNRAALLMVGDVDQLPSVGPGQVLADIIASAAVPVVRLTQVFRQAAQSRIVVNAHHVNEGRMPGLENSPEDSDFYFVPADEPDIAAARIVELVKNRIPRRFGFDPVRDIQVLCPMNRGAVGARSLNVALQAALNPAGAGERKVERFGAIYAPGDKVMQIQNDYDKEVYNGDIGYVRRRSGGRRVDRGVRRPFAHLSARRTRFPGAGLCHHHPQEPGIGISRRGDSAADAALSDAAAQSRLHRHHPGQEARGAGGAGEGGGQGGARSRPPAPLVEARRLAEPGRYRMNTRLRSRRTG